MWLVLLVGCATIQPLPEADIRQRLGNAGLELWPSGVKTVAYSPHYSYLEPERNGFFSLILHSDSLTNVSMLSAMPISELTLYCPKLFNLTPLSELPLKKLSLVCRPDADLSFVRGMRLRRLDIACMQVEDLSFVKRVPIEELWFNPFIVTNGLDMVASSPRLDFIVTCRLDGNRQSWSKKAFRTKQKLWGFRPDSLGEPPAMAALLSEPLSLCMTTYAGFTTAREWEFTVQANRQGVLIVDDYGRDGRSVKRPRNIHLSEEQFATVRKALAENHFFSLATNYGDNLIDASSRGLSVRVGDYQKTILIRDLQNRLLTNDNQLESAKQLLKIWETLTLFADIPKECLDWTEHDAIVLEWKAPNHGTKPLQ